MKEKLDPDKFTKQQLIEKIEELEEKLGVANGANAMHHEN